MTVVGVTGVTDFLDKNSGFFSTSALLLIRICFSLGVSMKSHSKLLLLWQLESGLAIGTITGDKVSSSSGSRTYLEIVSSVKDYVCQTQLLIIIPFPNTQFTSVTTDGSLIKTNPWVLSYSFTNTCS